MPSVTPACFASMLTGALPSSHGIMKYEKPILAVKTLLTHWQKPQENCHCGREGLKLSLIFRNRKIHYFIENMMKR